MRKTLALFFLASLVGLFWGSCASRKDTVKKGESVDLVLPRTLQDKRLELSSMTWLGDRLLLVPQYPDRFGNSAFCLSKRQIDGALYDGRELTTTDTLTFRNLDAVIRKIGKVYEGFEAVTRVGDKLYFTIETKAEHADCYLVSGVLYDELVVLDADRMLALPKLKRLSNAGYEALSWLSGPKKLIAFFEYNKADAGPKALLIDTSLTQPPEPVPMDPLMFRLTDVTAVGKNRLIGTNFHYSQGKKEFLEYIGADSVLTLPELNGKTPRQSSFSRVIQLDVRKTGIRWKQKAAISFKNENWEGIAPYKNGALIVTDEHPGTIMKWIRF